MPQLWRDVLYSVRSLARTPALTATIVLTVGIGLGATTGMVSVVRAVLVNPLPYAAPGELFWLYTDNPPYRFRFSVVDYRALEADHPTFSSVAAYQTSRVTVTEGGAAERVTAKSVTGSYFPLLGQTAPIGRLFDASDDTRGDRVAVLTAAYWARRFGSDPAVLGRTHDHRRRELHRRRRAAEDGRPARAQRRAVHRGALAAAQAQGPVLHDGAGPPAPGRVARGGARHAARHERAALSHLEIVVSGREGHVGPAGSEGARRRRRGLDARRRARRGRVRAPHRLRERHQPAHRACAQPEP